MFFYSKYKLFRAVISTLKIANLPGTPLKIEASTSLKEDSENKSELRWVLKKQQDSENIRKYLDLIYREKHVFNVQWHPTAIYQN